MPVIYKSVLESLSNRFEIKGMSTLLQWNIALSNLIDIYNPVFENQQLELSSHLFEILNQHFNNERKQHMGTVFKIISKLGSKCRHYKDDKDVWSEEAEDGIVLTFWDRYNGKKIKLGIDIVLQAVQWEIFEQVSRCDHQSLSTALDWVKTTMFLFFNEKFDKNLMK